MVSQINVYLAQPRRIESRVQRNVPTVALVLRDSLASKPRLLYRPITFATAIHTEGVSTDKPVLMSETLIQHLPPPPLTKTDEIFLEESGVQFVWGTDKINLHELNDLFEKVGFPRRDPTRLAAALNNTYSTLWVKSAKKTRLAKEGALLGFARATSDGALSATIWDVAVAPAWQRIGLGRALVERLTAHLVNGGISTITLYAEPGVVGLYEKLGFVKDPDNIKGLAFQSKSQKGKALMMPGWKIN